MIKSIDCSTLVEEEIDHMGADLGIVPWYLYFDQRSDRIVEPWSISRYVLDF